MNENKTHWFCPICNASSNYASLYVDNYFVEILNKCNEDRIQFLTHEDWSKCFKKEECLNISIVNDENCIVID